MDWAKEKGQKDKILSLADALEVTRGYESALEGWFENRLESLIASDRALALEALGQVAADKQGRVAIHLAETADATTGSTKYAAAVRSKLEKAAFDVAGELTEFVNINKRVNAALKLAPPALLPM